MSPLFEARSALFVISADGGEPKAERAARILYDATTNLALGSHDLGDDFLEFDHRTIAKVEAGRLWLDLWKPLPGFSEVATALAAQMSYDTGAQ